MEIWQAIVLGAVQGFAEFLPVSSSGHLILVANWFGIKENAVFYSIMLHLGTLVPVLIILRKKILGLFKSPFYLLACLIIATIPAGIIGLLVSKLVDLDALFSKHTYLLSITFLITAIMMFISQRRAKKNTKSNLITKKSAFMMGCGQAIGVLPGISRSGSTLFFGYLAKIDNENNATFTFLMSIPIIISAVLLKSVELATNASAISVDFVPLLFGIITAMVSGYLSINLMLSVIKKANYKWFCIYLLLISAVNLIVYIA